MKIDETNRIGRKKYLLLCSHLKFKYFNFCKIFLQGNQSISFLSQAELSQHQKFFIKMAAPRLDWAKGKIDISIILKTRIIGLQISYSCFAQFSSVQFSSVQFSSVQFSSVQFSSVQFSSVQFSSVQFSSVQFSSVQFSSVQFSSVQFSSVQFSSVQFSSVQFSSVQFSFISHIKVYNTIR